MKREDLLKSKEFWLIQIQNDLLGILEEHLIKENINRTQLAKNLKVTKGYISQVFNGDFDHKISKMVELSLASGNAPILSFVNINKFIKADSEDKIFDLMPMQRPKLMTYEKESFTLNEQTKKQDKTPYFPASMVSDNQQHFSIPL